MTENAEAFEFNVAYHPTPYLHAMRDDLREIGEVCDGVYMPFSESDVDGASTKLRACVELAHEMGLVVIAGFRGHGNLFESEALVSIFTQSHPECNCVTNTGRILPISCPNKAATREFLRKTLTEFTESFEPDGFFWNKPAWATPPFLGSLDNGEWLCYCSDCKKKFEETRGNPMPEERCAEVEAFRAASLIELIGDLCETVKGCGEHLITSVRVSAKEPKLFREGVAATPKLDVYGVDLCWRPNIEQSQKQFIEEHAGKATRIGRANGKLVEVWACASEQIAGREMDAHCAVKSMASQDVHCLNAWSYRNSFGRAPVDGEALANPDLVWQNLRRAYHEIRDGDLEIHS
jgi:hypothetical protein